jgi:hypothetical protein
MHNECPDGVACFESRDFCKAYGAFSTLLGLIEDLGLVPEFDMWRADHARTVCVR